MKKLADGKMFMHTETGEIVVRKNWLSAYCYFKADGKRCGYPTRFKHVIRYR